MKPLKKRIQIAMGGQRRKFKASQAGSGKVSGRTSVSKGYRMRSSSVRDSSLKDSSLIAKPSGGGSLALLDTVIRIYYTDLTDSVLTARKKYIKAFIARTGTNYISEVSLTDIYSEEGFTNQSIKSDISKYLMDIGVSKHRLFWRSNKREKTKEAKPQEKKLLYLEIRFH
ncbi:MAG: hypothetical protein HY062_04630 [Bacteroidetes bacterium]|nr:hypothetical protein [Bacteroidota bacterium]